MQPSTLVYKTANGRLAFRLSEIPDEGYRFEGVEVRPVVDGVPLAAPLPFTLKILREDEDDKGFALLGSFPFATQLPCSRCTEPLEYSGKAEFAYYLLPASEAPRAGETHLDDADMDIMYYENDEMLLDTIAEEQLQLALPFKLLCRPDCKGLCLRCGQNLNIAACDCPPEAPDPRMGAFDKIAAELFKKN
jgi:uncharacterized metal-binding protein YceD (DUF177 family)